MAEAPAISPEALARECSVFARYLTGKDPGAYLLGWYAHAHSAHPVFAPQTAFDRFLLRAAGTSPALALLADSYASFFARQSTLRKKLILVLGILESLPPEAGFDERIEESSPAAAVLRIGARGMMFALRLALAVIVFMPFHLLLSLRAQESGR